MKTVLTLSNKSILLIGLLSIGVLGSPLVAFASQTSNANPNSLTSPTGSVEDLGEIEQRDIAQDLGGIGGSSEDLALPESDFKPEMSAYEAKTRAINLRLDVSDEKLGDTSRITRRLPFLHF